MRLHSITTPLTPLPSSLPLKKPNPISLPRIMMASPPLLPRSTSDNGSKASSIKNPSSANAIMRAVAAPPEQHQQALKCPRCDSSNTKFCYYNNYSLSQPRYFCKACRRYWTKGGALRNVPVGGGCRKSKKSRTGGVPPTLSLSSTSSSVSAAANSSYQLGMLPSGVFNGNNQFFGFNYPIVAGAVSDDHMYGYGTVNHHHHSSSIASSIESLSSINQDLHWKLQQQRLAIMFEAGGGDDHNKIAAATATPLIEPISCQAADQGDKAEICVPWSHDAAAASASATAWFLEGRINGNNGNNSNNNRASYWNGITTWSDMPHFSALQ